MSPIDATRYPPDWKAISQRIRERDGNRCKTCGVENGALVERAGGKVTKVVLTVAHLYNSDPMDVRDENLAALCQMHHLALDRLHHIAKRRETLRARKLRLQPELPGLLVVV